MTRSILFLTAMGMFSTQALAVTADQCNTYFAGKPTEIAWCLASISDYSKCRNHPKLTRSEEIFCLAASEGYGKCAGFDSPAEELACEAMAKNRLADCDDGITRELRDEGGEALVAAKSAAAVCKAYIKPLDFTCGEIRGGDYEKRNCLWMVDARLFILNPPDTSELDAARASLTTPDSVNDRSSGVPEWAAEDYRRESVRTLAVSMTMDGKVGSVYFPTGRIRTVHGAGPEAERDEGRRQQQFNIDEDAARAEFDRLGGGAQMPLTNQAEADRYWGAHDRWIAAKLAAGTRGRWPRWATFIASPEDAPTDPSATEKLFEVFYNINGRVEGWHPSRGTLVRFDTNKQVISVLESAIKYIDDRGIEDPDERNKMFYLYIRQRLPNMEQDLNIRRPDGL